MKYFTAKNLEELRKEYKKLMVKNHPDNGGDVAACQEITAEYKKLFDMFKAGQTPDEEKKKQYFRNEIMKTNDRINRLDNAFIEFETAYTKALGQLAYDLGCTEKFDSLFYQITKIVTNN